MSTHFAGPIALGKASMPLSTDANGLSAAVTLTAAESNGMSYILDGGTGFGITLPAPTQGWRCKFTIGANFATDFVFTAGTAGTFTGSVTEAGVLQLVTAANTITLEDGTEVVGDFLEFWSDGTNTFVHGVTSTAASVTPAGQYCTALRGFFNLPAVVGALAPDLRSNEVILWQCP